MEIQGIDLYLINIRQLYQFVNNDYNVFKYVPVVGRYYFVLLVCGTDYETIWVDDGS